MLYIQLEKENQDLKTKLQQQNGKPFPEEEIMKILRDVSLALHDLHSCNIAHLDIKPANIILGKEGNYLLADFGHSVVMNGESKMVAQEGDTNYFAPEFLNFLPIDLRKADVYSLGMTILELVLKELPISIDDM